MSIEGRHKLRCSCSFRSTTDYRSPINGLSEINRFELFYKHCIPTGFPDRLLKGATGGVNPSILYEERSTHDPSYVVALSQAAMSGLRRRLNRSASFLYQEKLHEVRRDLQA